MMRYDLIPVNLIPEGYKAVGRELSRTRGTLSAFSAPSLSSGLVPSAICTNSDARDLPDAECLVQTQRNPPMRFAGLGLTP
jgi:hypothetical protein